MRRDTLFASSGRLAICYATPSEGPASCAFAPQSSRGCQPSPDFEKIKEALHMEGESRRSFMKEIGAASALAAGGFLNRNPHNKGVNSYLKKEYCNSYQLSIGR